MEETFAPLAQSIGRAVLGAAALEKVLLVDIVQRHMGRESANQINQRITALETQPAGALLAVLRELDISKELADRIQDVIHRRNHLVHHFMADLEVISVFSSEEGMDQLIDRVDQLAADCQALINEIGPTAFSGAEKALGMTIPELVTAIESVDPETVEAEQRAQLELVRALGDALKSL